MFFQLLDCYLEAYHHVFDPKEKKRLAQVCRSRNDWQFFIKDPQYLFPPKFECFLFVCLLFFFFYNCWIVFFLIPWKFSSQFDKTDILISIAGTYRGTDKGYGGKFVGDKVFKLDELWHSPFDSHCFFPSQIMVNVMHSRPRYDFSADYFVKTYRAECVCLRLHCNLIKSILDKQV